MSGTVGDVEQWDPLKLDCVTLPLKGQNASFAPFREDIKTSTPVTSDYQSMGLHFSTSSCMLSKMMPELA